MRRVTVLAWLTAATVGLAACGGEEETTEPDPPTPEAELQPQTEGDEATTDPPGEEAEQSESATGQGGESPTESSTEDTESDTETQVPEAGGEGVTQEQADQALLTEEEFPLDGGWTRGPVQPASGQADPPPDALTQGLLGAQDISPECREALSNLAFPLPSDIEVGASAEYTAGPGEGGIPRDVQLRVGTLSGAGSIEDVSAIPGVCTETLQFNDGVDDVEVELPALQNVEGVRLSLRSGPAQIDTWLAGDETGETAAFVLAVGDVTEEEVEQLLQAQLDKLAGSAR